MNVKYCMLLFLLVTACSRQANPGATVSAASSSVDKTATQFGAVNLKDTTEDKSYAAPGEDLAKTAGTDLIGKAAPVVIMTTIDGQTVDLAKVYGRRPVYLKFWATWCIPCRQQMPAFQKLYEALGDKMQFVALDIGLSDDLPSIRSFREKYDIKMPIVVDDGHLAQLFNLKVTPQHVLIGRDARFAYFGHAENKSLDDAVQRVLSEQGSTPVKLNAAVAVRAFKTGDGVGGLVATTTSGHEVALAGAGPGRLRGVLFFSSWCEWYLEKTRPVTAAACARARQSIERLSANVKGVDWIGIAGGPWATAQDLATYTRKHNIKIPLALDMSGKLFRAFGIRDIPTVALIDSTGTIVKVVGPDDANLGKAVQTALNAQGAGGKLRPIRGARAT